MQRNQNQLIKKNSRLKLIIVILASLILVLIVFFSLNFFGQNSDENNGLQSKNSSIQVNTGNSLSQEKDPQVSSENDLQSGIPTYAVKFDGITMCIGTYGTLEFSLIPTTDGEIEVSYDTPDFPETQHATLEPTNIATKLLKVNEHSTVKNINIETELKLSDIANAATEDFFYPFNGNDTRVYAYYMNNGNIALAFQPGLGLDQYQVIEFEPTSNKGALSYEQAKNVMQENYPNSDVVYADFGSSVDDIGYFRKLKATSVSMKQDGGSGTLGFVKVYSDGTVVEANNGDFVFGE